MLQTSITKESAKRHPTNTRAVTREWRGVRTLLEVAEKKDASVGGKAYALARLKKAGFEVPDAVVVSRGELDPAETERLLTWWQERGRPKLAVRSSAVGEDSAAHSFAGQLESFLEIDSPESLVEAIRKCFASIHRPASVSYQSATQACARGMNVVVQEMISPAIAGVFFSKDPRPGQAEGNWYLEYVEGLGESLVSGQVTPRGVAPGQPLNEDLPGGLRPSVIDDVVSAGLRVAEFFGCPIDMEWAVDQNGKTWVLQARPITTLKSSRRAPRNQPLETGAAALELARLQKENPAGNAWDGRTFAEWTGVPSEMTVAVWSRAFSEGGAFDRALQRLGYDGFAPAEGDGEDGVRGVSVLERVFGRPYLNLRSMETVYFRHIPYRMVSQPHPHLEFDASKLSAHVILRTPISLLHMSRVAWRLHQSREDWLRKAAEANSQDAGVASESLNRNDVNELRAYVERDAEDLAVNGLVWPFVLVILIDSSMQTLHTLLEADLSATDAEALIASWMASDLRTLTSEMDEAYAAACADPSRRKEFLARYGHRGPGEMDLANRRWRELGDSAFREAAATASQRQIGRVDIEATVASRISPLRRAAVLNEWHFLKAALAIREIGKSATMARFARLREPALTLGRELGLGDSVFWLKPSELADPRNSAEELAERASRRESLNRDLCRVHIPIVATLAQIAAQVSGSQASDGQGENRGEALSPGRSEGVVRVIRDPARDGVTEWPADTILVAEATDPGWTPLFQRVRAVVVERGGALSHCAILARELGLPAVSGITACTEKFKDGDRLLVDGDNGTVRIV